MSDEKRILFQSKAAPEFRWLSNFHLCKITWTAQEGLRDFHSVEHIYQCFKATTSEDFEHVYAAMTPSEARKRGQAITCGPKWEEQRDAVMEMCVTQKFKQNPELLEMLLLTDGFELVEFAPWDKHGPSYWGVNKEGKGENKLGKILMKVREDLLKEKK